MKRPEREASSAERPRQLPLELKHGTAFSRDDLIVADCNRQAVDLIDRWPDWSAPVALLAGPTGSGKSHLSSIWCEASGAIKLASPSPGDIDLHQLGNRPLLIDDIGAGRFDENGLFHIINSVLQSGSFLLMTSRHFPAGWSVQLPDLTSRLKAATIVEISEPDEQLLGGVMMKLFADRQITVEAHVISYLVHRIERSLATVMEVVDRLDRAGLENKARISRVLAAEVLGAMEADQTS